MVRNSVPLMWPQVRNPATGDVIANVPCMGAKETNDAISSANDAFACKKIFDIHSNVELQSILMQ